MANSDNNVQKASEKLVAAGYEKRDTTAPRLTNRNKEEQVQRERQEAKNTPPPVPKMKTNEEKNLGKFSGVSFELKFRLDETFCFS